MSIWRCIRRGRTRWPISTSTSSAVRISGWAAAGLCADDVHAGCPPADQGQSSALCEACPRGRWARSAVVGDRDCLRTVQLWPPREPSPSEPTATEENRMIADSQADASAATDIDRAAHAYCPVCHPAPQPGDRVTALCGASHPFWGRRERPVNTCPGCAALATAVVFECGHSG
jgi:hypothetical protein